MNSKVIRTLIQFLSLLLLFDQCAYKDQNDLEPKVDCSTSTLSLKLESVQDVTSCKSIDGKIKVVAEGGTAPYDFSINGGVYQTGSEFINLAPGNYTVRVKDVNNCEQLLEVNLKTPSSNLSATYSAAGDSECFTDNGSVTITATGGKSPYTYQIDAKGFGTSNAFQSLKFGQHTVIVKDADECQNVISIQVPRLSTGISYANKINPLLVANCTSAGCHGANSTNGDWTKYSVVKSKAELIKTRTGNKSMPLGASLTAEEISSIACWVDDGAPNN